MNEQKKIGKSTKIVIAVIAVLAVVVAVLAIINRQNVMSRLELVDYGTFLVTSGEDTHTVSIDDMRRLGPVAVTSSPRGERRDFTGVPLAAIFRHLQIDYSGASGVAFMSLDGFMSGVSLNEALDETNVFVVFEEDGEPLGTREEGGRGPYMIVVAQDPFPNRWARYLMEIILQ